MRSREEALELWRTWNDDDYLFRHALSVEAALRWWARKQGEDEYWWGLVGLLHDIDYQRHPNEHLAHAGKILREAGYTEAFIHAVESHGWGLCSTVEPVHVMEKALYAVDELCGFIYACAIMRPSKSLDDLEAKSVLKKFKTPAFAAKIDRSVIQRGAELLGMELGDLVSGTIEALRPVQAEIGLQRMGA